MVAVESRKSQGEVKEMTPRERSNANLKPQRSDEPGHNPAGRPKNEFLVSPCMRAYLKEIPKLLPNGVPNTKGLSNAQLFAMNTVNEAMKGNTQAAKEVLDRVEGKVKEVIEQTINDVTPIKDMTPEERKNRIRDLLKATNRN